MLSCRVCTWDFSFICSWNLSKTFIRDKQGTSRQQKHTLLSDVGEKNLSIHQIKSNQEGSSVEEIPDIDDEELPECDKFSSLYLFGKMLGESVPVKTITTKSKSDWMPKGK